jgi:ubiquinone/menaquinone biosynthesis C-methylase UbiE
MMIKPDWYYDDLQQVGIDFDDTDEVATYDMRHGADTSADDALLRKLNLKPHQTMADLGCGIGILACQAAISGARVHAVDISRPMLRAVEARAAAMGLTTISFHHAGFLTFDLGVGMLDLVTTKFALHHLPDFWKVIALTRVHDALQPGGQLFLADVVFACEPHDVPRTVEGWDEWMTANTGYTRDEVACHIREEHTTFGWIMGGLIERAGFRLVSCEYSLDVYATYVAERVG